MTNHLLPRLAERVFGRPLLITPALAEVVHATLGGRIAPGLDGVVSSPPSPGASQFVGTRRRPNGYAFTRASGRTALISVIGSLVNRGAWLDANCGLVSYEGIAAQVREAAADKEIDNIVLDIDSGGGEAGGMFGLAATIREARKAKYVVAVVDDTAGSAAYGIASSADEVLISPTSMIGSIGVVMLHLDHSGQMEQKGVIPTLLFAGAHKVDGHPFGPLPDDVRADLETKAHRVYDRFLEAVAFGRGARLSAAAARATEARIYIGQDAINAGLADRFGTVAEVLDALASRKSKPTSRSKKGSTMLNNEDSPNLVAQARADERARIKAILNSPEAQGRETSARAFALESDMPVEAAKAALAGIPIAASTPAPHERGPHAEFGTGGADVITEDRVKAGWKKAFGAANPGRVSA